MASKSSIESNVIQSYRNSTHLSIGCLLLLVSLLILGGHAKAEDIRVGVHISPPWSFENKLGEILGVEKDIIEKSFANKGYSVSFEIYGYSRLLVEFSNQHLDFASPITAPMEGAYLTDIYLPFQDVSVSLSRRGLRIDAIEDLVGRNVVAYQQAHQVLGEKYRNLVASQDSYLEFAGRNNQLEMLFVERVDAVVGEKRILTYVADNNHGPDQITIHHIFPETHYGGAARSKKIVDDFNAGLVELRRSGEYEKILNQYK